MIGWSSVIHNKEYVRSQFLVKIILSVILKKLPHEKENDMNRFIPWCEIYIFGPIAAMFIAFGLGVTFAIPNFSGTALFSFWIATSIILFICVFIVVSKWFSPPDYLTQHKVAVWSDIRERNFVLPTLTDFEFFLDSFCERTLEVVKSAPDLTETERGITRDRLRRMLHGAKFLFTRKDASLTGLEWGVRDKGCAQRGKLAAVRYASPFTPSNIFHVLWHMVDSEVLQRKPDKKHENLFWWKALDEIQTRVESDVYQVRSVSGSLQTI
jgi:hypothetical protein